MNNINIIFGRIRPHIKLNNTYTSVKCIYDGDFASITAELIPSKVGIVTCINEVMGQRGIHILVHLASKKCAN